HWNASRPISGTRSGPLQGNFRGISSCYHDPGGAMPVGMLQMMQGVTKDQYDQVNEQMFGQSAPAMDQLPDGIIVHSARLAGSEWHIYDIWESRDHFQRFMDGQLGEAIRAVFGDQPPPPGS